MTYDHSASMVQYSHLSNFEGIKESKVIHRIALAFQVMIVCELNLLVRL